MIPSQIRFAPKRRDKLLIMAEIIYHSKAGALKTQIMYKANLSWILLCDHLSALGDQGFVGEKTVGNRKKYSLTGKGIEIVGAYLNLIREIIFDTATAPM